MGRRVRTIREGCSVGSSVGDKSTEGAMVAEGAMVGRRVRTIRVGCSVGSEDVGIWVTGIRVGARVLRGMVGESVGCFDGPSVTGIRVGARVLLVMVGESVGCADGFTVDGFCVGICV